MQEVLLIIGGNSTITSPVTRELKSLLQGHYGSVRHISSLADTATAHGINITQKTTILSLSDVDAPFSQTVTESSLQSMKQVLHSDGSILWVTQGRQADNPFANMTVGLVRSVLLEVPTLAFQFLNFEDFGALQANVIAETLVRFKASLDWNLHKRGSDSQSRERPVMLMTVEWELVVDKQGQMLIPRMYPAKDMNERYNSGIHFVPSLGQLQSVEKTESSSSETETAESSTRRTRSKLIRTVCESRIPYCWPTGSRVSDTLTSVS